MCDEAGASRGPMEKKRSHTVVHLFAGSGGCTLGFKRAGLRSLGSFDFDPKACRDLERLTGGPAFCVDLQGFPVDCYLEGPSSSSKGAPGRREHIGNAIPAPAAEAFGREVVATLDASDAGEVRLLAGGDIWVEPEERAAC